jgi:hypothetical protein
MLLGLSGQVRCDLSKYAESMRAYKLAYKILVRIPQGRGTLGKYMHRLEDNIKMDLIKVRWEDIKWVYVFQNSDQLRALINTAIKFQVL